MENIKVYGMWKSPHKKHRGKTSKFIRNWFPRPLLENGNAQSAGSEYTLFMGRHDANGGHSGNQPNGKKKRNDRFKTGLPGTSRGVCVKTQGKECHCGGCH